MTAGQVAVLPAAEQRRLVHFLLRWEAFTDAQICLEQITPPLDDAVPLRAAPCKG